MEIIRVAWLFPLLILTACQGKSLSDTAAQNDEPTEWTFDFFTPRALPALVTYAVVQDADGKVYEFNTLNRTSALPDVIGEWNDKDRVSGGYWNHVKRPPDILFFAGTRLSIKKSMRPH